MYMAAVKNTYHKVDQANVQEKVKAMRRDMPDDSVFYRPCQELLDQDMDMEFSDEKENQTEQDECAAEADDQVRIKSSLLSKNKLLFVHQTKWQKRLLNKYGNELTLPDATYKTTRYALPLFFSVLVIKLLGLLLSKMNVLQESERPSTSSTSGTHIGIQLPS